MRRRRTTEPVGATAQIPKTPLQRRMAQADIAVGTSTNIQRCAHLCTNHSSNMPSEITSLRLLLNLYILYIGGYMSYI